MSSSSGIANHIEKGVVGVQDGAVGAGNNHAYDIGVHQAAQPRLAAPKLLGRISLFGDVFDNRDFVFIIQLCADDAYPDRLPIFENVALFEVVSSSTFPA